MPTPVDPLAGALCANLDLEEAAELFFPESKGGQMRRTQPHPKPDNHAEARSLCVVCPALAGCLSAALTDDGWTFRGLSPEERAVFGGVRSPAHRKRAPYLTVKSVAARIVDAGYDHGVVAGVLAAHDGQQQLVEPGVLRQQGVWLSAVGWSGDGADPVRALRAAGGVGVDMGMPR